MGGSVLRIVDVFFFQAEDGIRDLTVTGVQTCALPISTLMFMQQLPKPGPGACVAVDEWERIRTSAPLKTPALYMSVFAAGDASSSAGVPDTVTVPGGLELVRNSATAIAAASPTGPRALCWSPWKSRLVPRSASYSTMTPRFGPGVPVR